MKNSCRSTTRDGLVVPFPPSKEERLDLTSLILEDGRSKERTGAGAPELVLPSGPIARWGLRPQQPPRRDRDQGQIAIVLSETGEVHLAKTFTRRQLDPSPGAEPVPLLPLSVGFYFALLLDPLASVPRGGCDVSWVWHYRGLDRVRSEAERLQRPPRDASISLSLSEDGVVEVCLVIFRSAWSLKIRGFECQWLLFLIQRVLGKQVNDTTIRQPIRQPCRRQRLTTPTPPTAPRRCELRGSGGMVALWLQCADGGSSTTGSPPPRPPSDLSLVSCADDPFLDITPSPPNR